MRADVLTIADETYVPPEKINKRIIACTRFDISNNNFCYSVFCMIAGTTYLGVTNKYHLVAFSTSRICHSVLKGHH